MLNHQNEYQNIHFYFPLIAIDHKKSYYLDKNDIHVPPEAIITDSVALACLIQQLKPTALAAIPAFDFNPAGETEHMQNYELLLKLLE